MTYNDPGSSRDRYPETRSVMEVPRQRVRQPKTEGWARLGRAIREERRRQRLTQAQLAEGLTTRAHLSNVEGGIDEPSLKLVEQLERRLNVMAQLVYLYMKAAGPDNEDNRLRQVVRQQVVGSRYPMPEYYYYAILPDGTTEPLDTKPHDEVDFTKEKEPDLVEIRSDINCTVEGLEGGARYIYKHTYMALRDGVRSFSIWRHHFPGLQATRTEIGVKSGGTLKGVYKYGNSFMHAFELDRRLDAGQTHQVIVETRTVLPNYPVSAVTAHGTDKMESSRITASFPGPQPWRVWYFKNAKLPAGLGSPSTERHRQIVDGIVSIDFTGHDVVGDHGLEWDWVDALAPLRRRQGIESSGS